MHCEVQIDQSFRLLMHRERLRDFTIVGDTINLCHLLEAEDICNGIYVLVDRVVVPIRIQTQYISFAADYHSTTICAQMKILLGLSHILDILRISEDILRCLTVDQYLVA